MKKQQNKNPVDSPARSHRDAGMPEYRPDKPGPRDQPTTGAPGNHVEAPPDLVADEEMIESAVETGRVLPPVPKPPPHPGERTQEEGAAEIPPNPALH
jgi:hypothetical protein